MTLTSPHMRALVFDGPAPDTRCTRVIQVPVPDPGPGQITLDVQYAGINFKDVMARRGDAGYVTRWPFVPGLEVSGIVRALGAEVAGLSVGDRVAAFTDSGGLAQVAVAPAELAVRLPEGLDLAAAAAAPGAMSTAALLVGEMGRLREGETVLVHSAAGGVGQAVVRLARLAGAQVLLGTVGSHSRVQAAERAGYDAVFVRGAGTASAVVERTGGQGVDLILDPQGTDLLDLDLAVAAVGARIVMFGNAAGGPLAALPPTGRLFAANASIGGFSLASLAAAAPRKLAAALRTVLDHLAAGELDVEQTFVAGLDEAAQAQQALSEGRGRGKQIVDLRSMPKP
jgi:NADPH2:quinone reductase